MKIPWKFILNQFLFLRIFTLICAWWAANNVVFKPSFPYSDVVLQQYKNPLLWSWANFDGVHYLILSKDGYAFGLTQAFFPLYFLMIRFGQIIFQDRLITALLISNIFFIASLIVFYKLLRLDYDKKISERIILFLVFFPTSFYFLSAYNESVFLFLLLSIFYFSRKKEWWKAGLVGILLTLTRIVGIFIIPALLYEVLKEKTFSKKTLIKNICWVLLPSLGLLSYMGYLNWKFNDPFLFVHVQAGFGAGRDTSKLTLLYQVFWRYIKMIMTVDQSTPLYFTIWLEFLSTISFIGLIIWGFVKKIRPSYLIFSSFSLILPTLTGTFSSMPRYVLVLFPGFILLGLIKQGWIRNVILAIFLSLAIVCIIFFTRGYWIA